MAKIFRFALELGISIVASAIVVLWLPPCIPSDSSICIILDSSLGSVISLVILTVLIQGALVFEQATVHNSTPARIGIAVFLLLLSAGAAARLGQPENVVWRTVVIFLGFYFSYSFAAFYMARFQDGRHVYTDKECEEIKKERGRSTPRHPAYVAFEVAGGVSAVMKIIFLWLSFVLVAPVIAVPVLRVGLELSWYWTIAICATALVTTISVPGLFYELGLSRSASTTLAEKVRFNTRDDDYE